MSYNWKALLLVVTLWNVNVGHCRKVLSAAHITPNCSAIEEGWAKWHQDYVLKHAVERRKLAGELGCDAYQLSGDFSWISRIKEGWVRKDEIRAFTSLKTRQHAWHGKRATGLLCPCNHPLSDDEFTEDGLKAMLVSALDNEESLERQKENSKPLLDLVSANPDSVILVGNSAKLELLSNSTGDWIDSHATVMRFNTNWRADLVHLAGSKRDVWVTGDYRSACGCQGANCCTPEQLAALWERVGPFVKVYNGQTPGGHEHLRDVAFTRWSSGPLLWNYYLWLRSHDYPHVQTAFPYPSPTRTGMTGLFGLLIHGIAPKLVGFDTGGCMHADYYEVLHAREDFAAHKHATLQPALVLKHYRHEPVILSELDRVGLIRVVEAKVTEDCADGVATGVHKEPAPEPAPALVDGPAVANAGIVPEAAASEDPGEEVFIRNGAAGGAEDHVGSSLGVPPGGVQYLDGSAAS